MAHPGLAAKAHFAGRQGLLTAVKVRDPANTWDLFIIIILLETFWLVGMCIYIYYTCIYACTYIYIYIKTVVRFFLEVSISTPSGTWSHHDRAPFADEASGSLTTGTNLLCSSSVHREHRTLPQLSFQRWTLNIGKGWLYGGFHKWGYPKKNGSYWKILLNWMISEYPHFRKPSYLLMHTAGP